MRRTVKIKLDISDNERYLLGETAEQFREACQTVIDAGWKRDDLKVYSKNKLHDLTYDQLRKETDLPANLVIRARDRASEAIKGCVERLKKEEKASRPQFTSDSIAYDKRTLTVWLDENRCSISTVEGRIQADFQVPEHSRYYEKYLDSDDWEVRQSTVEKHEYEDGEPYYLHLGLEREVETDGNGVNPTVMGVDLGIDNLAVTSTGRFYSGDNLNHERRWFEEIRGKLQAKGTRSAHLTIQEMSGRENRFACDTLHRISKDIVQEAVDHGVDVIAFENLADIRKNLPPQKQFHSWCFKQLYNYVEYKAQEHGIHVEHVNPEYTSQRCSKCGFTVKENRDGSNFECQKCGYELHSDYNAAKNIGVKFLRNGQKSRSRTGHGQLALKSGLLKPNGTHIPASKVAG
jgi:IS605 OrfB family transposase